MSVTVEKEFSPDWKPVGATAPMQMTSLKADVRQSTATVFLSPTDWLTVSSYRSDTGTGTGHFRASECQ